MAYKDHLKMAAATLAGDDRVLLTYAEFGRLASMSKPTIRKYIKLGVIKNVSLSRKLKRIPAAQLRGWA